MIVSAGEALVDLVPNVVAGGGPMNVAVAAARLGADAAFLGRLSTDEYGVMLRRHLEDNKVNMQLVETGDEPTARAIVEHEPILSFRFEGENTADVNLQSADLTCFDSASPILHAGALGIFRGRTASVLIDCAENHDGLVSLDPNVRPQIIEDRSQWLHFHDRWVDVADVYRGSDEDFGWIWPGRELDESAAELLDRNASVVIVTHGGSGATIYLSSDRIFVPAQSVKVVDTVGAGDSFVASILVSLAKRGLGAGLGNDQESLAALDGDSWKSIVGRATAVSAITCTRVGADSPYVNELPDLV